jgi:uncharacterized protein
LPGADPPAGEPFLRGIVSFGHALRDAGFEVGPDRIGDALRGLEAVDPSRREDAYWVLRQTLVSRADQIETFDRVFADWFLGGAGIAAPLQAPAAEWGPAEAAPTAAADGVGEDERAAGWSYDELLRKKDFSELGPAELARLRELIGELAASRPRRVSRRLRGHRRGDTLDLRSVVRASLATGGEPLERAFRRRTEVHRKLVVLCDVSGSMEPYVRAILLYVHALLGAGRGVEAFSFGTRLTRLTEELSSRDPERALARAAGRVVDWSGGTRIGDSLKTFNDVWGRRSLARGAVVVIVSDGWERENAASVGREMARLARYAYAVVWLNPLKGHPEYEPLAGGMRAALPYVDRFQPGHNLASLEELAGILAGLERRHGA